MRYLNRQIIDIYIPATVAGTESACTKAWPRFGTVGSGSVQFELRLQRVGPTSTSLTGLLPHCTFLS